MVHDSDRQGAVTACTYAQPFGSDKLIARLTGQPWLEPCGRAE